ncbi:MAG: LptF/LptG family permease [Paludibacteraceae bacterium]|nr:LptF/LptG family permease [Paludibacteraceae bacterium]MBQ2190276.1 LptF/LptG family permease [Paludibacteraceae bacterium]MBQ2519902.1 LptF/LptG family permease [Paludibacteraceae bacterium]MBQ4018290.1 LptF/LptG family permease [Paludibacteraceae bacterium]MBQ5379161.1 LptF/LptG family permease [Paludibacteraceae bacterium]
MKRLDWYIIRKFLGTFFFSIVLILSIAIVFDLTEKMDDFFENQVPLREIIFDYYLPFIPYYMNMFSSLFIFISVIFFTSKLAGNSEIIAMHAAGMSYHRLMVPYALSATLLFVLGMLLGGWVIPRSSERMLHFTDKYVDHFTSEHARNLQLEVEPGTILYIESFQRRSNIGYRCSIEKFDGKTLIERTTADRIYYDSLELWHLDTYTRRRFDAMRETLDKGRRLDITLPIIPDEMFITAQQAQQMTTPELRHYMQRQRERGSGNVKAFEVEYHKRWASPLGAFIMTLLGVTMSSRKVRGGMGKNLGIGLILTAGYILFSTVSTTFSVNNVMSPFMAAWLPNFIFLAISIPLYIRASK